MNTQSNDLRHSFAKIKGDEKTVVKIRLNDECHNGHQDFSITCDIYERKKNGQFYDVGGGAAHEHILKLFPELQIFVNLHLCDYLGIPMYAVENGFYHMKNGYFQREKPMTAERFQKEFCEYYRITSEQFTELASAENETRFAIKIMKLGILEQWKAEADKAIKMLEEWTGKTFEVDSVKTQFHAPDEATIKLEDEREASGYYTPEKIAERRAQAIAKLKAEQYAEIEAERNKETDKAEMEYQVKKAVLDAGFTLDNFIFYDHTKEAVFNWKDYEAKVSDEDFQRFLNSVAPVSGVTWSNKPKR